jgi:hypothetical protein
MARTKKAPTALEYYRALQEEFKSASATRTAVLTQGGARGSNDEERFRQFLQGVLPKRFSVGKGFVVSSDPALGQSNHTDVVIYDEFLNAPLHRELSDSVFPVEMVYATIEVKGLLQSKDLQTFLGDVQKIRALADPRWYMVYGAVPKKTAGGVKSITGYLEVPHRKPKPRAFLFAYDVRGWQTLQRFEKALRDQLTKTPAHIHGLAVLSKDWYVSQIANAGPTPRLKTWSDNALLRFVNSLLHNVSSMPMAQMSIDRYLKVPTSNPGVQPTPLNGRGLTANVKTQG